MLTSLGNAFHTKCCMDNSTLWPCGLGCQQLGPCCYPCGGNNLCCSHFALDWIMSHLDPLPNSLGELGSPITSCNIQTCKQCLPIYMLGYISLPISFWLLLVVNIITLYVFVDNSAFIGYQLSVGLGFSFGCSPSMHISYLVYSCSYGSCIHICDSQKGHNHNQGLRVNSPIIKTIVMGELVIKQGIQILALEKYHKDRRYGLPAVNKCCISYSQFCSINERLPQQEIY